MKIRNAFFILAVTIAAVAVASLLAYDHHQSKADQSDKKDQQKDELLLSLGINNNDQVTESSGLAYSTYSENSIWTLNDSGHSNELLLLKTDGTLLAKISIKGAINVDWEAMAGFKIDGISYLVIADVGDNLNRRKNYQLYLLREPNLAAELQQAASLPLKKSANATTIQFTYEDGPKNCEAIGVNVAGKQFWLVEKIYYTSAKKKPPGIYAIPLSREGNPQPVVAKRIGDFPPRNVTGMDFSPDGKRLIIRNYLTAHLYSRSGNTSWQDVIAKTKPATVVLPLQRQGEAICFTPDSKSVILTSELKRQPIWQVNLQQDFARSDGETEKTRSVK